VASILSRITKHRMRINSSQVAASTYVEMEDVIEDQALKLALSKLEEFDEYTKIQF